MPKLEGATYYLGLDPGVGGGLAVVSSFKRLECYHPMPDSPLDLWNVFNLIGDNIGEATLEFVSAFPGMGAVSAFTFGGNFHSLQVALAAKGISHEIVRPVKWMAEFNIPKRGQQSKERAEHKERLRVKAQQLFPKAAVWAYNPKTQRAVCDAILLAEYTRRKHQGKLQGTN